MPQIQKSHVREAILRAAAEELAEAGYAGTTLSAVATKANISIGNVYKYFSNKEELFGEVVPPELVQKTERLLRQRIEALGANRDARAFDAEHPYHTAMEELLEFATAHRHELLFLLRRAEGSVHASFARDLAHDLTRLALAYAERAYPTAPATFTAANRRALERIYRGFLDAIASILAEERSRRTLREAVYWLTTYHLSGLRAFFEAASQRPAEASS